MANVIYPKWKQAVLQYTANGALNGSGTTGVYAVLVDTGTYVYSSTHEFYSSLSGIVGTEQEIGATKSYTDGVFDGGDLVFPSVSGATAEALVLFIKNAGANTTWRLFAYIDSGVTGLPVTPNTGNINVAWHISGIVAL